MRATEVAELLASFNSFRWTSTPYGFLLGGSRVHGGRIVHHRIESGSGIAGRSNAWSIAVVETGARTAFVTGRRALRRLILEWLAEGDFGPRPPLAPGDTCYATSHVTRFGHA